MSNSETLAVVLANLSNSLTYNDLPNPETNQRLWNRYAKDWNPAQPHIASMIANVGRTAETTTVLGQEWSDDSSFLEIFQQWIEPHLHPDAVIAEIGQGGGRVTQLLFPRCKRVVCFDVADEMLSYCKQRIEPQTDNVDFVWLPPSSFTRCATSPTESLFPDVHCGIFDFVLCFDVMPHVDLHTQWIYMQQLPKLLKSDADAKILFHTANLLAPLGWQRFAAQKKYTAGGFYFQTPHAVRSMARQARLEVIRESKHRDEPQEPLQSSTSSDAINMSVCFTRE